MTLALLDAGLPMDCLVTGTTCMITKEGDIYLEPTTDEIKEARSSHTFVFSSKSEEVLFCDSTGNFTPEEYFVCLDTAKIGCAAITNFCLLAVERKLSARLK